MSAPNPGLVEAPRAIGELVDKITILEIKSERLTREEALRNVRLELDMLRSRLASLPSAPMLEQLSADLKAVNGEIWDLEDTIRECERQHDFAALFVETARKIYRTNDRRAALKRRINEEAGSALIEEKSYAAY